MNTITAGISAILLAVLFVFFLWTGISSDSVSRIGWAVLCLFFYVNVNDNWLKARLKMKMTQRNLVFAKSPDNTDEFETANLGGAVVVDGLRTRPLSVFLAGGISGVKDNWQETVIEILKAKAAKVDPRVMPHDNRVLIVYNPRRAEYVPGGTAAYHQIGWEHRHLKHADAISFWFPPDTLCPITLFELGSVLSSTERKIILGVHPKYARAEDVRLQTLYRHPTLVPRIVDNIPELADKIWNWFLTTE